MKKSNKGFTLIELLAVIVILAIIALIATPVILSVIDTAKKGAAESSALGYVDAVEKQIMIASVTPDETDGIADGTDLAVSSLTSVKVKGSKPAGTSTVTIVAGQVTEAELALDGYTVFYNGTTGKASASK